MRAYQLILKFYSPLLISHPPMLDSVIAYALEHKTSQCTGYFERNLGLDKNMLNFPSMIKKYILFIDDVALISELRFDDHIEFLDFSTKKFETKFPDFADFGKAKRRVNIQGFWSGSRKTPLRCIAANQAYWYFIGDGGKVWSLFQNYIIGIGKRVNSGWGWIDKIELRMSDFDKIDILKLRPVPAKMAIKYSIDGQHKLCAYKIPYWDRDNVAECVVPYAEL